MIQLVSRYHVVDHDLGWRMALRVRMLKSSQGRADEIRDVKFPQCVAGDLRQAQLGEEDLDEMRILVDEDAPLGVIKDYYEKLKPLGESRSAEENDVWFRAKACYCRALKNAGHFREALQGLKALWLFADASAAKRRIASLYADTLCECADPLEAMRTLSVEINFNITGTGNRMQLALANAYLAKALFTYRTSQQIDGQSLFEAECLYSRYTSNTTRRQASGLTKTIRYRYHLVCAGIAMVSHTLSFSERHGPPSLEALQKVILAWKQTSAAAKECWPTPGFAELIAAASLSEVASRAGLTADATRLKAKAKGIGQNLVRQYHFTLQGTVWLDIIEARTQERFTKVDSTSSFDNINC